VADYVGTSARRTGLLRYWSKEITNFSEQQSIVQDILLRRALTMNPDYAAYIRDLFYMFREAAAEAQQDKVRCPNEARYHEGREMAYVEALLRMQSQADAFMIPREDVGLAEFDPLKDPLEPPKPSRDL
jgi:hypothetical protein